MDTYEALGLIVNRADLTLEERAIAMTIAMGHSKAYRGARIGHKKLSEKTGASERTIKRIVASLEEKGVFRRVRTGRSNIYRFDSADNGRNNGIVDRPNMAHQTGQEWPISNSRDKDEPWLDHPRWNAAIRDTERERKDEELSSGVYRG